ncbi:hypothetical protein HYH03_003932 [Edaphochlamys debaryana]|uniref:EGF-like domain-containing protein n=1 Tax=Edaphochlamys debaryana TaxID=47281 RepID=A0A836C3W3_9CHLO|nr:hypothetical protein HYH03_003932 [Edaphochlamys debaryana]|eukprot:KAG2498177.1 hypothetical protein HYH03_003932 [Edaphochlamys debaryana]
MLDVSYHLALLLGSGSADAPITLRGLLTTFAATTDPATNVTTTVPAAYPTAATAYSFELRTTPAALTAQLAFTRRQLGYGAYTGLYLCAEAPAAATLTLRGATHSCPFTLGADGKLALCSGRGTADTCPHGTCACPAPYAPPPNAVVPAGLGFDDCSASLQPLQPPAAPGSASAAVAAQGPGRWAFFRVEVPAGGVQELELRAEATEATQGSLVLYLRHQQLPGLGEAEHDASSAAAASAWRRDLSAAVTLRKTDAAFRAGEWYVGVYSNGPAAVTYGVTADLRACPGDCSGRGSCAADTGVCTCADPVFQGPDCGVSALSLSLGAPLDAAPRPFVLDHLTLPAARSALRSAATSRLVLSGSFRTDPALPDWVTGRPMLIVVPSAAAAAAAIAAGTFPSPEGAVARITLVQGNTTSLEVGPWMISDDDMLHVLVWNAVTAPRKVGYTVSVSVAGSCLSDCSGHGTCDTATGLCACTAPWAGGDCSVDTTPQPGPAAANCTAGSVRALHKDDMHGTCWQPCKADGSGYDETTCADWTCDGPTSDHFALRRKGAAMECVEDTCVPGSYTVTDPSGDFTCAKRCACPEDGSACRLDEGCEAGSVQCLKGLSKADSPERCVPAPCPEGSLQRAYDLDGGAGAAFALCACSAKGDPASCAYTQPAKDGGNAGGVVSCAPGMQRQGSTASTQLSDGTQVVTGGFCAAPPPAKRKGVSGGMVFFYCLLSIALASGLLVGSKYGMLWYEQYRYGRSVFSQGYVAWPLFGNRAAASGGADDW